jgi:NCS2 family nucleobase:cation symporter-2
MKKPANVVYGVEERPPTLVMLVSALQHVGVIAIFMIYPLIIGRQAGVSAAEMSNILRLGMLGLALATVLQALPKGPVGSRFLAPSIYTGIYLAPSLLAVKLGGLSLVWGMTIFAGLFEIGLSRVWIRLRTFIPPESAGLVVFLVGVTIGLAALRLLIGTAPGGAIAGQDGLIGAITLTVMIGLNNWNKGKLRLFCIIVGMVVGYALATGLGTLTPHDYFVAVSQPLVMLPSFGHLSYAFDASMIIPFAVSGLAAAMSTTAVVTTYQRITDADWVRPDMASISRGIFGDGIAAVAAGLLGSFGPTVSTANVGLTAATGVTSRCIAWWVAAILLVAAFQPTLVGIFAIMPPPVMAAALLFTAMFIMIGGVQIISSRILDPRRTLVIGMGMTAYIVVAVFPAAFTGVPGWMEPLVTSPLVLATIVALFLNLVFRIGIRRTVALEIERKTANFQAIADFIERQGGIWGARRDVITRVQFAMEQAAETVIEFYHPSGPLKLAISYDEFDIDAALSYIGPPFRLADRAPTQDEMLESVEGGRHLGEYMIKCYADNVSIKSEADRTTIALNFRQ